MTCPKTLESDKTPLEIAEYGNDSLGGLFDKSKLPDPWLFDSEALLRELDRIRETALQVPTNGDANATHFGLQLVVNAAWNLRENIRYILGLHLERQRAFGKQQPPCAQVTGEIDTQHQTIYVIKWMLITLGNRMLVTPSWV